MYSSTPDSLKFPRIGTRKRDKCYILKVKATKKGQNKFNYASYTLSNEAVQTD